VPELPGFVNWLLAMPAAAARQALARDVKSITRMEAELSTLLDTDHLAEWAERYLVWDEAINADQAESGFDNRLTIGNTTSAPETHLYASYLKFIDEQGRQMRPLALRNFKAKLVDMLRDTLGLPLPPGNPTQASQYKDHKRGSLVPCLRWRKATDDSEAPGVIRHAFQARIAPDPDGMDQEPAGMDSGWIPDGKNPVRDSRDGLDGFSEVETVSDETEPDPWGQSDPFSSKAAWSSENPSHPSRSVPDWDLSIPNPSQIHPDRSHLELIPPPAAQIEEVLDAKGKVEPQPLRTGSPICVDGQPGWTLPGTLPKAPTSGVAVVDPKGRSKLVERKRITQEKAA
jgi:hypothetical protein